MTVDCALCDCGGGAGDDDHDDDDDVLATMHWNHTQAQAEVEQLRMALDAAVKDKVGRHHYSPRATNHLHITLACLSQ